MVSDVGRRYGDRCITHDDDGVYELDVPFHNIVFLEGRSGHKPIISSVAAL